MSGVDAILFSREPPPLLYTGTLIYQGVKLIHSLGQPDVHLGMYPTVAYVGLECNNHSCRVDVWNVPLYSAEPLHVLPQSLSFLLREEPQVTGTPWFLMAACEGANKLMAQAIPG